GPRGVQTPVRSGLPSGARTIGPAGLAAGAGFCAPTSRGQMVNSARHPSAAIAEDAGLRMATPYGLIVLPSGSVTSSTSQKFCEASRAGGPGTVTSIPRLSPEGVK